MANIDAVRDELLATLRYNMSCTVNRNKITPMLWGPAGVGKSSLVREIAAILGYEVIELRLATINPVDARGFPKEDPETGKGTFTLPFYFPTGNENRKVIIFLDEINTATPVNQVSGYELCQDYSIGGRELPIEVLIVAAGNREEDGGATFEMPLPLANRLQHLEVLPNPENWINYGLTHGIREEIIGYINFKKEHLSEASPTTKAFASPRTWEKLSMLSGGREFTELMVSSLVGDAVGSNFMSYLKVRANLPDLDKTLEQGIGFQHPEKSVMYAFVSGLVIRLLAEPTVNKVLNFTKIMDTLPPELRTVGLRMTFKPLMPFVTKNMAELKPYRLVQKGVGLDPGEP